MVLLLAEISPFKRERKKRWRTLTNHNTEYYNNTSNGPRKYQENPSNLREKNCKIYEMQSIWIINQSENWQNWRGGQYFPTTYQLLQKVKAPLIHLFLCRDLLWIMAMVLISFTSHNYFNYIRIFDISTKKICW